MSDEASRERERASLVREIEILEGLRQTGGDSDELAAAVAERHDRIERLSGVSPSAAAAAGAASGPIRSPGGGGGSASSVTSSRGLSQEQLREIFEFYCNFGRSAVMTFQDSLDSFMFMKFARECPGLLDESLTPTDIDLIFVKAKPKFERRLDFEHFLDALAAVAERKFPDLSPRDGLRRLISGHLAPHYDMVQIEMSKTGDTEIPLAGVFKKLYDPRSYTGVYAERFRTGDGRINGESDHRPGRSYKGSTNTGTDEIIHDVSVLMRPNLHGAGTMLSPANHMLYRRGGGAAPRAVSPTLSSSGRGGAGGSSASVASGSPRAASLSGSTRHMGSSPVPGAGAGLPADPAAQAAALQAALARAQAGDPSQLMALTMALAEQVKRMQGSGAGAGGAASAHGSPAGSSSSAPASRGRHFFADDGDDDGSASASGAGAGMAGDDAGARALRAEVEELESDIGALKQQLDEAAARASRDGPTVDDSEHIREVTDAIRARRARIADLVSGASRPLALATPGRGGASSSGAGDRSASRPRSAGPGAGASPRYAAAAAGAGGAASVASSAGPPAINQEQLREVFEFYCNFGRSAIMTYQDSLDSFMFMKFARECPDLMDRRLNATEVDLIFTKAKPKFERRLLFTHFLDALSAMAERKYPEVTPVEGLRLLLSNHLAPHYDMVQVEMSKTGDTEIPLAGVFKKLYDPRSYTGVYAERFRTGDGRINGESDNRPGRSFSGNTNTGTDEIIHDISVLMRPHLRSGTMMRSRPITAGGSPRRAGRSQSPRPGTAGPRSPSMDARSVASGLRR